MIVLTALVIVMSTLSYNPFYRLYRENGAATLQEYHLEKLYNKLLFCIHRSNCTVSPFLFYL